MSLADPSSTMTTAEFLRWAEERPEGERYELLAGRPVSMAPERNRHNLVKIDCWLSLRQAIRAAGLDCTVLGDGATVEIDDRNAYEPDVTVQCGEPIDVDAVVAAHPTLLVEVLSPSTKGVDSSDKLLGYFQLPSVRHYLVVDPVRQAVIHHRRVEDGIATALLREGTLSLDPPGIEVDVSSFFETLRAHVG